MTDLLLLDIAWGFIAFCGLMIVVICVTIFVYHIRLGRKVRISEEVLRGKDVLDQRRALPGHSDWREEPRIELDPTGR